MLQTSSDPVEFRYYYFLFRAAEYLDTFSELDKQVVLTLNTPQAPVVPVESEQAQVFEQEEALKPLGE